MANETTATLLEEVVPTEDIDDFIASFEYPLPVSQMIAWLRPSPLGSVAVRFPRWNQINSGSGVPAGTKSEGASFTRVPIDMTESSQTPGIVGFEMALTDEVRRANIQGEGIALSVLVEAIAALIDRMDSDTLSGSTSATTTIGTTTDDFTFSKFNAAAAGYRAMKLRSMFGHAFGGHNDAFRDLTESVGNAAAMFQANTALQEMFGPEAGYHGRYLGFEMMESANVSAESPGWSNFMTPIGAGTSGLGVAITEMPSVRPNRGSEGERDAEDLSVFRCWYAGGLINPRRLQEVLSRT